MTSVHFCRLARSHSPDASVESEIGTVSTLLSRSRVSGEASACVTSVRRVSTIGTEREEILGQTAAWPWGRRGQRPRLIQQVIRDQKEEITLGGGVVEHRSERDARVLRDLPRGRFS